MQCIYLVCVCMYRYNNFQHDPLARCSCSPPYSGENGISARSDLNPANGTYPFGALAHRCHGGTDNKVSSVCVCVCVCVRERERECVCMHMCMCVHACLHTLYVCVHACVHMHVCACVIMTLKLCMHPWI